MHEDIRVELASGAQMNLHVVGQGPWTVILESGWLQWSPFWAAVQDELSTRYRSVAVDRLGLGASTAGQLPRSTYQVVDELQEALLKANLHGPYVAVGAGFGALHTRVFAFREPTVRSLVLVDPVVEVLARSKHFMTYRDRLDAQLQRWRGGVVSAWAALFSDWPGGMRGLPTSAARRIRRQITPEALFTMRSELGSLEESVQQVSSVGSPAMPCIVLSRPASELQFAQSGGEDAAVTMQRKLAEQAPRGRHQIIQADGYVPIVAPAAIARAIDQLTAESDLPEMAVGASRVSSPPPDAARPPPPSRRSLTDDS
ncbi:MAG: alpha/beta fold hydrolase [Myxococcota bacterium]